jgi:hypothetical protein
MLRLVTIAYLSITSVLGPAFCCCAAQGIFSVGEASTTCCEKPASASSHAAHGHRGDHEHGHHHHKHRPPKVAVQSESAPVQNEHDSHDCSCGEHQPSLVNGAHDGGNWDVAGQSQTWLATAGMVPTLADVDGQHVLALAHARPANLFGRGILRAYQVMRC